MEVFSESAEFAAKITWEVESRGQGPQNLLQNFRNSPSLRVAVTVDMIATGTDVPRHRVRLLSRSVQSAVYFEQMKAAARIIGTDDYAALTPDVAKGVTKDRFVIVDAVGVCENHHWWMRRRWNVNRRRHWRSC